MTERKLGKYQIVERLGRGGMAEVYRGYDKNLDRYVAIKVLHAFLADDPEFKDRFRREAQNVARLKHPNIVQVYDFDFDPDGESYYMVMELVDGPTLKDRLLGLDQTGPGLPLTEIMRIVREAASALAYAHKQNMIHRDVKPANLMLDHDERVVLTDFGIAKIVTGAQFTASGGMVGTPAYMAPEQGLGEAGDERSDLYSLGIIMYQLLTNELPYEAEAPLATILKHLNSPIPLIREINPDVPEPVAQFVMKLMAKAPADRYQNATDLIEDLDRIQQDEAPVNGLAGGGTGGAEPPIIVTPPLPGSSSEVIRDRLPPEAPVRRRGWLFALLAAVLIVIVVGGYVIGVNNGAFPPLIAALTSPTPTVTESSTPAPTDTPMPVENAASATPTETLTDTPSRTPGSTATSTPSRTPSRTASPTATERPSLTPTRTPTSTPSRTPTITRTPSPTSSPTITNTPMPPTPDITQTLRWATQVLQFQTATVAACKFDYAIVEQTPADGDFYQADTAYQREIRLLNTGTCAWERNTSLVFVEGEDFNAERVFVRERVNPGDEVVLLFQGVTPATGGTRTGTWELRTPGQIVIGEPLQISIAVFEQGN